MNTNLLKIYSVKHQDHYFYPQQKINHQNRIKVKKKKLIISKVLMPTEVVLAHRQLVLKNPKNFELLY